MADTKEDLTQLARFLFNSAARFWWWAWLMEVAAGILATGLGLVSLDEDWALLSAASVAATLLFAYALRLRAEGQYDLAETMRRQSVFSEGLGWSIAGWQRRRWLERAGVKRLQQLSIEPREDDYYATTSEAGPRKLGEMTLESAFYTRFIYRKFQKLMLILSCCGCSSIVALIWIANSRDIPSTTGLFIATALLLAVPTLISLDFLGWVIRLGRLADGVGEVEKDLEQALEAPTDIGIMRLVSEYNCLVVAGVPVMNWMFMRWHDEILQLWRTEEAPNSDQLAN